MREDAPPATATDGAASAPRVRVVVVDFDGGDLTRRSLHALLSTECPAGALEIVLVDNGSVEPLATRVGDLPDGVRLIRSDVNRGFAGGNNLALGDLDGIDLVALVNNDVMVPPGWLNPLVEALRADERRGAASPKMLLDGRYRQVDLSTHPEPVWRLDRRPRGVRVLDASTADPSDGAVRGRVHYASGFYEPECEGGRWFRWSMPDATLFVPDVGSDPGDGDADGVRCRLTIDADRPKRLVVRSGSARTELDVRRGCETYAVTLAAAPVDLVNNVGSVLLPSLYGADRGWLEPDDGRYDLEEDVFAWSGGAVLLRASYVRDIGLFDERLFLYYEDLELAWRGRERGWTYRYVPASVVRHHHAATARQDSTMSRYYNERNRLLVLARHATVRMLASAIVRYLASTLSYLKRDVVARSVRGARPQPSIVATRARAFAGFLAGAPSQLRDRRRRTDHR